MANYLTEWLDTMPEDISKQFEMDNLDKAEYINHVFKLPHMTDEIEATIAKEIDYNKYVDILRDAWHKNEIDHDTIHYVIAMIFAAFPMELIKKLGDAFMDETWYRLLEHMGTEA